MEFLYLFVVLTFLLEIGSTKIAPDFIHPCKELTPECLKKAMQDAIPGFSRGIPEMGIEPLDPFRIDNLDLMLPGGLKMNFRDGTTKGFKKCIIDSAKLTGDELEFKFHCNLTIKGHYRSSGRLLIFPINGEGESVIRCKDISIAVKLRLGTVRDEHGVLHLEVKHYKTQHSYDGVVNYHMTNLFKGNSQLSQAVLEFMNSNWRLVAEEFGGPIVDFGVQAVLKNIKQFFSKVPSDELFI